MAEYVESVGMYQVGQESTYSILKIVLRFVNAEVEYVKLSLIGYKYFIAN